MCWSPSLTNHSLAMRKTPPSFPYLDATPLSTVNGHIRAQRNTEIKCTKQRSQEKLGALPLAILRATGTSHSAAETPHSAQRQAEQRTRETARSAGKGCARESAGRTQKKTSKSLHIVDLSDDVRDDATHRVSRGGGTRTPDTQIMIQRTTLENTERNTHSPEGAANTPTDSDLQLLIDQWPNLRPSVRSAILDLLADESNLRREE